MPFVETPIPGLVVFEPKIFEDNRGYFFESYNQKTFQEADIQVNFVQDNQSKSNRGVLRGLHFQIEPFAQAKLIRVLRGKILDVAVDVRKGSPTYMQHFKVILSEENKKHLFVPRGFAHGFVVLENETEVFYKCDNFYSKEHDAGIRFDDPELNIDWELQGIDFELSEKDQQLPYFKGAEIPFSYGQSPAL